MQSGDWIKLLRNVPAAQVDNLSLVTSLGLEIAVQSIVQLDEVYMVVRGRMSGTNDGDKSFIVPYDKLCFLGFQRSLTEQDLVRLVNGTAVAEAEAMPQPAPVLAPGLESESPPEAEPVAVAETEAPAAPAAARNQASAKSPNMTALLERIRARSQQGAQ